MRKGREAEVAIRAAKAAGKLIMSHYGKLHRIKFKGARLGIVTEADVAAQKKIKAVIRKAYPNAGFLAEEDKKHPEISDKPVWVVDPLDGTSNYSRGIKSFAVSIALVKNRVPFVGVVLDPSTGDIFYAQRGKGAYLNDCKIKVSNEKDTTKAFYDIPLSNRRGMRKRHLKTLKKLLPIMGNLRIIGSAALRLSFLAAGRLDAYIEYGVFAWDVAAGILILEEAGGKITNFKGKKFMIFSPNDTIVATNGKIHQKIILGLNK